jgi:zinc/manganese transport system substrate-binding protein
MIRRSNTLAPSAARAFIVSCFAALAMTLTVTLTGCSTPVTGEASSTSSSRITIVASTNVWGNIAESIAGEHANVTSLISSASQDPHSFEASARDQLEISLADIVIVNGGGYDTFMDNLIAGAGATEGDSTVIDASVVARVDPGLSLKGSDGFNEHLWYSVDAVGVLAQEIADQLSLRDPVNAADYAANCDNFTTQLDGLKAKSAEIRATFGGEGAAITEPLPLYLLEAVGLINRTPAAFSTAFEEGIDVSPLAMRDTIAVLNSGSVSVFAYNEQTVTTQGEQIRGVATKAGIPVVAFAETLPNGEDYVSWMTANLNHLSAALRS